MRGGRAGEDAAAGGERLLFVLCVFCFFGVGRGELTTGGVKFISASEYTSYGCVNGD